MSVTEQTSPSAASERRVTFIYRGSGYRPAAPIPSQTSQSGRKQEQ